MATTEQLMTQYGVAWFGFDETSGYVYDKLGLNSYVGTVTGATRVEGWDGNGYAMNFNGTNQYIQFDNKIIPVGEKSIRFKVKLGPATGQNQILIDGTNAVATNYGIYFVLTDNGYLHVNSVANISNNWASYFPQVDSKFSLRDGLWHDVLFTWDGKIGINNVKLYIDNMLTPNASVNGTTNEINLQSLNLVLGKTATQNGFYFNGKIDDLQIYNKVLSPSDFAQKRLVVKTTDNKNLVLFPTSARVKEIPNTAEYMMLAQGGIVKEIDSAVDRPPIDFTKPTTEYEIVSNSKSVLGKGRMFTIPIGTDFKTAMIEDNY